MTNYGFFVLLLIGVILNGHTKPIIQFIKNPIPPGALLMVYRAPFSIAITGALVLGFSGANSFRHWPGLFVWLSALSGAVCAVAFGMLLKSAPTWLAFIGVPTIPIMVVVLSKCFDGGEITIFEMTILLLIVIGMVFVVCGMKRQAIAPWLLLPAACNAITYALYIFFQRKSGQAQLCLFMSSFCLAPVGWIIFKGLCAVGHRTNKLPKDLTEPNRRLAPKEWWAVAALAGLQQGLPLFIFARAITALGAQGEQKVAVLTVGVAVVAPIISRLWGTEKNWPSWPSRIGILINVVTITIFLLHR